MGEATELSVRFTFSSFYRAFSGSFKEKALTERKKGVERKRRTDFRGIKLSD